MSNDDPFGGGGGDRTMLRPTPGGGRPQPGGQPPPGGSQPPPPPRPGAAQPAPSAATPGQLSITGINPLVAAAGPLFSLAGQLAGTSSHNDVAGLATNVAQEISNFENAARAAGETPESILAARYSVCTLLDEIVLSTPWGAESAWGNHTLLVRFHNEAYGGEKFFQILERSLQDPPKNLDLIEFMYICTAVGLGGKYRVVQDGARQLQQIQDQVFETIRTYRGDYERALSPHWEGVQDQRPKLARFIPLWAIAAIGALLLGMVYAGFLYALNSDSDPVVGQIAMIGTDAEPLEARARAMPAQRATLATVLAGDRQEGRVEIVDAAERSTVTLWGLFPSGEAQVGEEHRGLMLRVGQALNQFPGRIVVTGHTDNVPIRSLRFPSNWILSERRAESVARILAGAVSEERLRYEGSGDSKPLVPNNSPVNKAINRRVEIVLYPQAREL